MADNEEPVAFQGGSIKGITIKGGSFPAYPGGFARARDEIEDIHVEDVAFVPVADLTTATELLSELKELLAGEGKEEAAVAADELSREIARAPSRRDKDKIRAAWEAVKVAAYTNETMTLVARIAVLLGAGPHHG